MSAINGISALEFCHYHEIGISFIHSLGAAGLVEPDALREDGSIDPDQIGELEKFIRLSRELDINLPGIEAIAHLLERMKKLQHEVLMLRNRLDLYESAREEAFPGGSSGSSGSSGPSAPPGSQGRDPWPTHL